MYCKVVQALLRLYWRVTYRHLTRTSTENLTKWYIRHKLPKVICDDLARSFMSKILTYQLSNQVFITNRLYSPDEEKLPLAVVSSISSIGTLDPLNGRLEIHSQLISIFKEHKCWSDFNQPFVAPSSSSL